MHAPSRLLLASVAGVIALALGAWVAGVLVVIDLARDRARADRRDLGAAIGLFVAAFAVRWIVPVHTLIHENKHGYHVQPYWPLHDGATPTAEGVVSSHRVLLKLAAYLLPLGREPVFVMNVALSSLAVAAMYALAKQLFASRLAAWAAASALLVQPVAILMAPTEEVLVATSGLCLAGLALVWRGARDDDLAALVAGACLAALGASSREVTLPLAALVPVFYLAATPEGRSPRWGRGVIACAVVAAGLLPIAIATILAKRALGETPAFIGLPHLPFKLGGRDRMWVGWQAPYMPPWMTWLALASLAGMIAHAIARPRARRAAIAVTVAIVIAQGAGGLVGSGWFPSNLRHQLFAMALLALPIGWLFGALDRLVLPVKARVAAFAIVPALGAATWATSPSGARLDAPLAEEYRFFRDTLAGLPEGGRAVVIAPEPRAPVHVPDELFWSLAPTWDTLPSRNLASLVRQGSSRPVYLFLDRTCFMKRVCIDLARGCQSSDAPPFAPSRYGQVRPRCDAALRAAPWVEIATRKITRKERFDFDIPSEDPIVTLAVLMWDGRPITEGGAR